jgi:hypothetical protein
MRESLSISNDSTNVPLEEEQFDLDLRVLDLIRKSKEFTVRPAQLSSELGISIEDATQELCGLMKAVGSTAVFRFERVSVQSTNQHEHNRQTPDVMTMVFTFPHDFEKRALAAKRKENIQEALMGFGLALIKFLKVIVAFGLIITMLILIVAGIIAIVALIIAISRGGGGGGGQERQALVRRMRSMFFTLRELLWCYAMFGNVLGSDERNQRDPFLQEVASSMYLFSSLLTSRPTDFWFWFRARNLQQRYNRGWGANRGSRHDDENYVNLVSSTEHTSRSEMGDNHRGILSIAVEFLFGPTPFSPGPYNAEKWKLRQQSIMMHSACASINEPGVALLQLLPFVDYPPHVNEGQALSQFEVTEALTVVVHFNGKPCDGNSSTPDANSRFVFPEIMAEAEKFSLTDLPIIVEDNNSLSSFLFIEESHEGFALGESLNCHESTMTMPPYLREGYFVVTKLTRSQFVQCSFMNTMNYIGIRMFRGAIREDGVLVITNAATYSTVDFFLKVLEVYAILFFVLPLCRTILLLVLNFLVDRRNKRRKRISELLS